MADILCIYILAIQDTRPGSDDDWTECSISTAMVARSCPRPWSLVNDALQERVGSEPTIQVPLRSNHSPNMGDLGWRQSQEAVCMYV